MRTFVPGSNRASATHFDQLRSRRWWVVGDLNSSKLAVWPTVRAAIGWVFRDPTRSLRIASGPLAVALTADVVQSFLGPSGSSSGAQLPVAVVTALAVVLVSGAAQLSFWVAWIRFVLRGNRADRGWFAFTFGTRELKFLFQLLKVGLAVCGAMAIAFAPVGAAAYLTGHGSLAMTMLAIGGAFALCVGIYLSIRLMFVATAAAVDSLPGLKASFAQTRGYFWRLAASLWLAGAIVGLPAVVIGLAAGFFSHGVGYPLVGQPLPLILIETLLAYLSSAIVNGSQAIAFREVTDWQ
jgi:hypothetical protein